MFTVDRLADENVDGFDWFLAKTLNYVFFNPSVKCRIEMAKKELRIYLRKVERVEKKLTQDIQLNNKRFAILVKKNESANHIRSTARLLHTQNVRQNELLQTKERIELMQTELDQVNLRQNEQEIITELARIYRKMSQTSREKGLDRAAVSYSLSKDKLAITHEMFEETFRSSEEFATEDQNVNTLVQKMIDAKGLEMPQVPVFMDGEIQDREQRGTRREAMKIGQEVRSQQRNEEDAMMFLRIMNLE